MPGPWHWKHFPSSVSFPGASGNPAGFGFCCASAVEEIRRRPISSRCVGKRVTIFNFLPLFSVGTDAGFLHHFRHLGNFALDLGAKLLRRARRDLEAERDELVTDIGHAQYFSSTAVLSADYERRAGGRREEAGPGGVVEAGDAGLLH